LGLMGAPEMSRRCAVCGRWPATGSDASLEPVSRHMCGTGPPGGPAVMAPGAVRNRRPRLGIRSPRSASRGHLCGLRALRELLAGSSEADDQAQRRSWPRIHDSALASEAGVGRGPDFRPADDDSRPDAADSATLAHDSGSTSCANSITSVPSGFWQTTIGSTRTTVSGVRSGSSMA